MTLMIPQLLKAAQIAIPTDSNDKRSFWHGCIGIREDGAVVSAKNGAAHYSDPVADYQLLPNCHAEGRVLRKLGKNGILYIARVSRKDRSLAMSRACGMCRVRIKAARVNKAYYTIDNNHYGIWYPDLDIDKIYEV